MKGIIQNIIAVIGLVLIANVAIADWSAPTQSPPGGNTDLPLNVSAFGQIKSGGLTLGEGTGFTNGLTVLNGKIGFGTLSVADSLKLGVHGNVGANSYCDEAGNSCFSAQNVVDLTNKFSDLSARVSALEKSSSSGSSGSGGGGTGGGGGGGAGGMSCTNYGGSWVLSVNNGHGYGSGWNSVAVSSDGKYQIVTQTVSGPGVAWSYTSSDYGASWVSHDVGYGAYGDAVSSSGQYQAVLWLYGHYESSDYGASWLKFVSSPIKGGGSIAMDSSGSHQTAAGGSSSVFTSSDFGKTWTGSDLSNVASTGGSLAYVAVSNDGLFQTVLPYSGPIFVSPGTGGSSWISHGPKAFWQGVAMSSDGKYQTAVGQSANQTSFVTYLSGDYGVNWALSAGAPNLPFRAVSMTKDGKYQTAVVYGGRIFISGDYGNSWNAVGPSGSWDSVSVSADGTHQTAIQSTGNIYTSSASCS